MDKVLILIPAYNPSKKLKKLVLDLIKLNFSQILIINDGSIKGKKIFEELKQFKECIIIGYKENKGKGYALKYGINYYLENFQTKYQGIITADADYQHLPNDIYNIALKLRGNLDTLILGSRNFNLEQVPTTSRLGNKITSFIFKLLYGKKITDTQTGLRGIPNRYLNLCLEIKGNRFEYETNVLIKFVTKKINILEVEIETVYYEISESKFNKFLDSFRVLKTLFTEYLKFIFSSFLSFIIDITLFILISKLFSFKSETFQIIFATCLARIISSFCNFNLNKFFVFQSKENNLTILFKYYLFCLIRMILSAILVLIFYNLINILDKTIVKIIVDSILYLISYRVLKKYIFKT